jgi:hypothetical protein
VNTKKLGFAAVVLGFVGACATASGPGFDGVGGDDGLGGEGSEGGQWRRIERQGRWRNDEYQFVEWNWFVEQLIEWRGIEQFVGEQFIERRVVQQ